MALLRPIKNAHIRPRIMGFRIDSTGGTPSTEINSDNVSSLTDNAAGDTTITFADPLQRDSLVFTTCDNDVGAGAIANFTSTAAGNARVVARDKDGTGADGTIHVLSVGFDSAQTEIVNPPVHQVKSPVVSPRLLSFHVDGTGTGSIVSGHRHATFTDNGGSGDYTLTFTNPFAEAPIVIGSVIGTSAGVVNVEAVAVNSVQINTYDDDGAATDQDFYLLCFGRDMAPQAKVAPRAVVTPQVKPRALFFELTTSGGTPSLTAGLGSDDGSVTDDGVGDFTITFTEAFDRAPEVYVTSDDSDIATVETASTTAVTVRNFTNAAAAADPDVMHILVLGYDDASQY